MINQTLPGTFISAIQDIPQSLLCRVYFFHDVRITCYTNHPKMLALLDETLGLFGEPQKLRGDIAYFILCYESDSLFPVPLPRSRLRTGVVRLLTNTTLKYYLNREDATSYQKLVALQPVNGTALTAISQSENVLLTQLEMPEQYQSMFLRRYVFLLALGQMMNRYGFEPCHAAAITAPWDSQQGALLLGESGSGKTTLALGCASTGCGLLGDDLVMLRQNSADEMICAFAITHEVSIRSQSLDLWDTLAFLQDYPADQRDKRYCSIEQVYPRAARLHTSIRLLLFPTLTIETTSSVTRLSKARTLQTLVDQSLSKRYMSSQSQEQLFLILSQLAEQAPGYQIAIARNTNDGPQLIRSLFTGDAHG